MFCPTCGFDCKDENYCPKCGRDVRPLVETVRPNSDPDSMPVAPVPVPQSFTPQPAQSNTVLKGVVITAKHKSFLFAAILFTIGALIDAMVQFESKDGIASLSSISMPGLKSITTFGIIAALSTLAIAGSLWGIHVQSTTKQTIAPAWFYIIFGALLAHLFFNAVIGIKTFSVLTKMSELSGGSTVLTIYAIAMLAGVLFIVVIDGIAAKLVHMTVRGELLYSAPGIRFLKTILLIFGWIAAAAGVIGLFLVKDSFFPLISVVAAGIARIIFGRILGDYTLS